MSADQLAAIEARAKEPTYTWAHELREDRDYLLAMVREQQARLDRVAKVALSLHDPRVIQHSFHIGSDPEHDAYKAQIASRIRAAITATGAGE